MQHTDNASGVNSSDTEPEQKFLTWFESLPSWQQCILAHLHTMMTSTNTAYFVLDGEEALRHFHNEVHKPDFPVRRVARLLQIRSVFSFVFYDVEFVRRYMLDNPYLGNSVAVLNKHEWDWCSERWRELCANELSDASLHHWLMQLD